MQAIIRYGDYILDFSCRRVIASLIAAIDSAGLWMCATLWQLAHNGAMLAIAS
jgi:hypothetical protein